MKHQATNFLTEEEKNRVVEFINLLISLDQENKARNKLKKTNNMKNNSKKEIEKLKAHMAINHLAPTEEIIAGATHHLYKVKLNNQIRQARYIATPYLFGDDLSGPALICNYGLVDSSKQYNYSSSETDK